MAEGLAQLFKSKCSDFATEPVEALLDDIASSQGACLTSIELNGSNKRLFNKRVSYMQVCALAEALAEDANIVSLDLSYNFLNDLAAQSLARLLRTNRTLKFINLCGNAITAVGAAALGEALAQPDATLEVLLLSGNELGDEGISRLGDMLRTNTSLRVLDVCNTGVGVKGIIALCSALREANASLEVLDMGQPTIHVPQDTTILSIAHMLSTNTALKELGLSKHGMVDSQLEALVSYGLMRNNGALTSLDLRANKLSAFSGPQLERLLGDNRSLVSINLAHNQLGDGGALSVARSLPYTHWLQQLDLRGNNIGEQGLIALAEALSLASHLQCFLVWGNHFAPGACRAFLDTKRQNPALSQMVTDIKPYEVDGRAQVALVDVDL